MSNDHNISNEDNDLNGMAPKLSKLKSNNPFNPSNDYFDSFTSKLQNRIEDEEDIKAIAPTLLSIDKYNPFEVSADYFDELPTLVQERVIASSNKPAYFEWLFALLKPRFAIPMLAIVFASIVGIKYMNNKVEPKTQTSDTPLSLEDHLYFIDESDIIELFTAEAVKDKETFSEEDDNIVNYLLENNIDISNL